MKVAAPRLVVVNMWKAGSACTSGQCGHYLHSLREPGQHQVQMAPKSNNATSRYAIWHIT